MRQRVLIAMALIMNPALVIADEPTTALDVTIQAQILELLTGLQERLGTSILMITHDLGVIAETATRVLVMYGGEIVEEASVDTLFSAAHHPYTEGLMHAMPQMAEDRERLNVIPGTVPPPTAWPSGCRFRDRCPYSWERCEAEHPPLYEISAGHTSQSSPSGARIRTFRSSNRWGPPFERAAAFGEESSEGFPDNQGSVRAKGRRSSRGSRCVVRYRTWGNAFSSRRIRLRKNDDGSRNPPVDRADIRRGEIRRP
jgi:oligopeptide/dipeptide ABC transporter ATP-binding protein